MKSLCSKSNIGPPKMSTLIPGAYEYVILHSKRNFADVIKAKDLEIERLSLIIQMGPVESHESLKAEGEGRRVADFEDGGRGL